MFKLFDKVVVKTTGVSGVILEIDDSSKDVLYSIESDEETRDEHGTLYPMIYCKADEIELV